MLVLHGMRYFQLGAILLGVILILGTATPVRGYTGLTGAVAAVWGPRPVSERLRHIAHQRVREISCSGCMTHAGMRSGTSEVLGYNAGYEHPIAHIIRGWADSVVHDRILSDRYLRRIGCAHLVVGARHYFACVLAH